MYVLLGQQGNFMSSNYSNIKLLKFNRIKLRAKPSSVLDNNLAYYIPPPAKLYIMGEVVTKICRKVS